MLQIVGPQELQRIALNIPHDDSTIFSVVFVKRSTGELRKMTCRRGVKKHLHGGDLPYNARENSLLSVYDLDKKDYRSIACESIQELKLHGNIFQIPGAQLPTENARSRTWEPSK